MVRMVGRVKPCTQVSLFSSHKCLVDYPSLRRELNLGRQRHLLKKTALHSVIWGHNPELSNEQIYAAHLLCARHCAKYVVSIMKLFEH